MSSLHSENYSASKPLKTSPEKSHILSCDTVVANERYVCMCFINVSYTQQWSFTWTALIDWNVIEICCLSIRNWVFKYCFRAWRVNSICGASGLHSGEDELSVLGCDTWTFWLLKRRPLRCLCNIGNQIHSDAASYPRRTDISVNVLVLEEAVEFSVCYNNCSELNYSKMPDLIFSSLLTYSRGNLVIIYKPHLQFTIVWNSDVMSYEESH